MTHANAAKHGKHALIIIDINIVRSFLDESRLSPTSGVKERNF